MSADFQIYICNTNEDEKNTFSFINDNTSFKWDSKVLKRIEQMDSIWIGEVSWLKASVFDKPDVFVPPVIMEISKLIPFDSLILITDELIDEAQKAFDLENKTSYKTIGKEATVNFLKKHKGKKCFTISW